MCTTLLFEVMKILEIKWRWLHSVEDVIHASSKVAKMENFVIDILA